MSSLSHPRHKVSHWLLLAGFTYISLPIAFGPDVWSRITFQAIATLVLAIWLIGRVRRRKGLPPTPLDYPLALLLLVYVTATLTAQDRRIALEGLWLTGIHVLLFYACVDVVRQRSPSALLEPLLFAAAVNIFVGLTEMIAWYFGLPLLSQFQQGWWQIGGLSNPIPPQIHRLTIPLGVSTWLAVYLSILIPVAVAWLLTSRQRSTRQGLALWLVSALIVEGLAFSRGGLLALAVATTILGGLWLLRSPTALRDLRRWLWDWRKLTLLSIAILIAVGLGWGWTTQNLLGHQAGDRLRWDMWRSSLAMIRDHPLTGVGVSNFGRMLRQYRDPHFTADHLNSPHNVPLYVGAEAGILGLLAGAAIVGVVVWAALRHWREAAGTDRIRVAGVIAALVGFAVYNLFDNFVATPVLLPALVLAAIVVAPIKEMSARLRTRQVTAVIMVAALGLSAVGWAISDAAQMAFQRSQRYQAQGNSLAALAAINRARTLDPSLSLYRHQRAQYLGEQVIGDEVYLPEALQAFQQALDSEGTYDVHLANYALLLARSGDLTSARRLMQQAAAIAPSRIEYVLWGATLADQAGDLSAANEGYLVYLATEHSSAGSAYWLQTSTRQQAREAYLQIYIDRGFSREEALLLPSGCLSEPPAASASPLCAGLSAQRVDNDPQAAVGWYDQAIGSDPDRSDIYVLRAEARLEVGDLSGAERDARTAIFQGDSGGYVVLGRLAERKGDLAGAGAAYQRSGPGIVQYQGWEVAVYNRRGSFHLLPLLDTPGAPPNAVTGWQALADLLDQQGRDSDAAFVRSLIERFAPYPYEP